MKHLYPILALCLLIPTCVHAQAPAPDPVAQAIAAYEKARADLLAQKAAVIAAEAREREGSAKRLAAFAEQLKSIDSALGSVPGPKPPEPPQPVDPLAFIREQAHDLALAKVAERGRAAAAQRVAAAILSVPQEPASDYYARLQAAVKASLGQDLPAWQQWSKGIGEVLFAQGISGSTPAAKMAPAWGAVAEGLRGVR